MTTEAIMTPQPLTLRPSDTVAHALLLMHQQQVRNLPVVDNQGSFVELFGIRRLSRLLLPSGTRCTARDTAARELRRGPDHEICHAGIRRVT